MEEGGVKIITLSDLLRRSRPVTAASSLTPSCSISPSSKPQPSDRNQTSTPPTQNPNPHPKTLPSLNHPSLIIGTLTLPSHDNDPSSPNPTPRCPKTSCFSFSDGSSAVCCDILDLDVRMIGRKIHVLAWNFIPLKFGGGFLEIITWRFPETSRVIPPCSNVFPLVSDSVIDCGDGDKARYSVCGELESVSPVSVVPCVSNSSVSRNVCGFLVQISVCKCKLCCVKDSKLMAMQDQIEGQDSHCFAEPVIVYFCGSASSWHPVIVKLIGSVLLLSGLKKKLVFIGEEDSQLMYVTSDKTLLHLPKVINRQFPASKTVIKGKGECGMYTGTVTGIYMQSMVVELDREVMLLLTDRLIALPHSLRVGAIVSMRNVHFVNPKFCWTKVLILGACYRTSIIVKSFSPFETGCCLNSQSQSLLGKFINSLSFSVKLWALLLVSSFRKKFAGILNEKEILGSNNVVPIAHFVSHCEATWMKMLWERETDSDLMNNSDENSHLSCEELSYSGSIRRIMLSEDIGVVLLGSISSSSGRVQLIDATGTIDVIIPDLSSAWNTDSLYEVNDFSLVMEGKGERVDCLGLHLNDSFLCRNIFSSIRFVREMKLAIYLLYHLGDSKSRNFPFHAGIKNKANFEELQSGRFHLLLVTHKYPVEQKFQGEQGTSSMFAEAFILLWDLLIAGKDGHKCLTNLSSDLLKEPMEHHYTSRNYPEFVPSKRYKIDQPSNRDLHSSLHGAEYELCGPKTCFSSSSCARSYQEQKCLNLCSPPDIPCFVTNNDHCVASSGILCCSKANLKVSSGCTPSAQKILLEFNSESFWKCELLRIGGYYIIKHHEEDILCTSKDTNDASCCKIIITSTTHLWSLSFSSDEDIQNTNLAHPPTDSFDSPNEAPSECPHQNVRPLKNLSVDCVSSDPDLHVHLSRDNASFLKENLKSLDEGLLKPSVSVEEVANISWCNETIMRGSFHYSGTSDPEFQLPEGNLISFHGHVVAVHNSGCSSFGANVRCKSPVDISCTKFFPVTNSVCIHVLVDHHLVKIFGAQSKHSYPIGFGPDITATFHRVLVLRGRNEVILTPTSFIVITAVGVASDQRIDKYDNGLVVSGQCNVTSLDTFPSALMSEIMQHSDCMPVQFHCRVVAIYILVLENSSKAVYPKSRFHSQSPMVNIPLAGFVIDDGSSSWCCWTNSEKAAILLRLHEEFSHENHTRSTRGSKITRVDEARGPLRHLDKILQKHGRVIVKNYGSMFDSSAQDLTFSVTSNTIFSSSDEDLLKFLILKACFSTLWTVVGTRMDSNAIGKLEKRLMEMEMKMHPMQNIWVGEIHFSNPLTEARKIAQELLNR
ncbi:hypothetical protein RHMOL_Rhmol06G0056300 [Rhododendron molle]|uniref:Uncharacterized protein n=1 Tax=Rhododendron molle TaxID=49168 RepID=A0ACC0N9A8_RHOML|nr:hypothetical protein RHMOL_Rhmol06G0056300 [Rhododendron molle]